MDEIKNFLESLEVETEEKTEKFKDVFLVTLTSANLPFESFGKGFTKEEALISAYGEMCERIITRNFFEEYYINGLYPDAAVIPEFLNKELMEFYEIDKLTDDELIDFNSDVFEILSIPFTDLNGKITYFPINLIQNIYASNGMAFHSSLDKAYYNAKSEVIERFVKFQVIKYALPLPKISHPLNSSNIQFYDATLGGQYPVIAASYIKDDRIILSFGCDVDKEKAAKKAYLELMQTKLEKKGNIINDIDAVRSSYNIQKHFINLSGDIHENFFKKPYFNEAIWNFKELITPKKEYFKIYKKGKFWAVHLIIPGFSEVYPISDLIYNNINYPKFERDIILNFDKYDTADVLELLDNLFVADVGEYIGVIFEKHYLPKEYAQLVVQNKKPKFSKKYENLKKLAKRLY
jgi:ribosomal protein S12 methylthiotransferase accessory factor